MARTLLAPDSRAPAVLGTKLLHLSYASGTLASITTPQASVRAVLDDVLAGLETVRAADRTTASDADRLSWVEKLVEAERRVSALKTVLIGEADEAGSAMRTVHTPLQDWLARSGQDSTRQAVGAIWRARELDRRPRVRDAAASGQISLGQAAAINQALNGLPTALDSVQQRKAEDLILAAAAHMPAEKLRNMSDRLIDQVAPLLTDTPQQRAERLEARDARARARRCLRFGPETDGSIADRGYRAAKDTRNRAALSQTPQQRLADALVTVSKAAEAVESTSPSGGSGSPTDVRVPTGAAQLMVVIPYGELLDRATGRGLLMDGTPVSPGELRRLACSADLIPVVLDGGSTIVDVGRAHRLAPPPLRLAVAVRDGGCAFPGCAVPDWHCDVHHIVPWQEGGPTDLANVVALCRTHHGLIEPTAAQRLSDGTAERVDKWQVRIDGRGLPEFVPPRVVDPTRGPIRKLTSHAQGLLDTG